MGSFRSFAGNCFCAVVLCVNGFVVDNVHASGGFTPITTFTATDNIQTNLIQNFPTGSLTTSNIFATPFTIPAGVNNFGEAIDGTITASINVPKVTNVYTLINAYGPVQGDTIGTLTFNFSDGTSVSDLMIAGYNVRDFYQGAYANSTTATNTVNAFMFANSHGAAGTGSVSTGLVGTYLVDEQDWTLSDTSTLVSATLTTAGGSGTQGGTGTGTPILLGLTVQTAIPEPAKPTVLVIFFAVFASRVRRRCEFQAAT